MPVKLTFITIIILGLLSAITPLAIDTYLPSIPTIARALNTEINLIQLTVSIYLVTFSLFQLLFGPMSDAFGRQKIIFWGLVLYIVGSLLCSIANFYELLMVGRMVQALGGAAVAVSVPALVKDSFSNEQFVKVMSYVFLVMGVAPLFAPILGGVILVAFDWHYIFLFLAIVATVILILFVFYIPETLPSEKRSPLSFKNTLNTYKKIITNRGAMGHVLSGAFQFGGLMCFVTGSPFVYIELYQVSESYFGLLFGLSVGGLMFVTTLNGQIVARVGSQMIVNVSLTVMLLSSLLLGSLLFTSHPPLWSIALTASLFICTIGSLASNLMVGAIEHIKANHGSVMALAGTFRFMLGALAGSIISLLHNGTFIPMITIMATCGLLSFACYVLIAKPANLKLAKEEVVNE